MHPPAGKGLDGLFGLIGRAINDQERIDTSSRGVAGEAPETATFDRIHVTHQDHRGFRIVGTELLDHGKHPIQRHALDQRPLAGVLDHRAIGHDIGKRHTDFKQIGTGIDQGVQQFNRSLRRWMASRDIRHQRLAPGLRQRGKAPIDAIRGLPGVQIEIPSSRATVLMSLSPRPDMLTSTI